MKSIFIKCEVNDRDEIISLIPAKRQLNIIEVWHEIKFRIISTKTHTLFTNKSKCLLIAVAKELDSLHPSIDIIQSWA